MPTYLDFFARNLGVVSEAEQERLRGACVGIAGNGGVGGAYAITLARMGVGAFHLADFDVFEAANFNRQSGATLASISRPKTEVLREMILAINPEAKVALFPHGITTDSVGPFLDGTSLVMDGLDFYALPARRLLFPAAESRGLHVVTSGPIGLTTTLHVFGPGAMPFEEYFDFARCHSRTEELAAFVAGVTPALLHLGQIDMTRVDFAAQRAPSFATAIQLCAGLACNEATRILLGRGTPFLAPRYFQFDPVRLKLSRGRLLLGNRGPLQRLKRRLVLRQLAAHRLLPPQTSPMNPAPASLLDQARTWAEVANHAPSGDNSQPWTVSLGTEAGRLVLTLGLDEVTRNAPSIFDCAYSASYLALGTFARNFSLLAGHGGYHLTDLREHAGLFTLTFAPGASDPPTSPAVVIRRRTTNRKPFDRTPLDPAARDALTRLATAAGLTLREFSGDEKSRLAGPFTALDRIRYRHRGLYLEFLEKLRFGAEADQSPDGLRDTTLGVPAPALLLLRALRALRQVRAVRAIFFLGFERVMAFFGCHLLIRSSASVFVLSGGEDTPLGWFQLGLCFEHLWLETTRRDLALQPLGTTLLLYRLQRSTRPPETGAFTPVEEASLHAIGTRFRDEFSLELARPTIAFRVGRAPALANTSLRRPLALHF